MELLFIPIGLFAWWICYTTYVGLNTKEIDRMYIYWVDYYERVSKACIVISYCSVIDKYTVDVFSGSERRKQMAKESEEYKEFLSKYGLT